MTFALVQMLNCKFRVRVIRGVLPRRSQRPGFAVSVCRPKFRSRCSTSPLQLCRRLYCRHNRRTQPKAHCVRICRRKAAAIEAQRASVSAITGHPRQSDCREADSVCDACASVTTENSSTSATVTEVSPDKQPGCVIVGFTRRHAGERGGGRISGASRRAQSAAGFAGYRVHQHSRAQEREPQLSGTIFSYVRVHPDSRQRVMPNCER